jgi:hypothetical protein
MLHIVSSSKSSDLHGEYQEKLARLQFLREQTERFIETSRAMIITLNTEDDPLVRKEVTDEIITAAAAITGATSSHYPRGNQERLSAQTFKKHNSVLGLAISCFSREFYELEMEVVALRARLIAKLNHIGIKRTAPLESKNVIRVPDRRMNLIHTAKSWQDVGDYVAELTQAGCRYYLTPNPLYNCSNISFAKIFSYEAMKNRNVQRRLDIKVQLEEN